MRILRPPKYLRSAIVSGLNLFFDVEHEPDFKRALGKVCKFYKLPLPHIVWFERLGSDGCGEDAGRCFENGKIHLIHPENWKKNNKYNTRQQWISVVLHELGHYALWAESGRVTAEMKADRFRDAILRNGR